MLSEVADNTSLYLHNSSNDTQPHSIMLWSHQVSQQTNSGRVRDQPGLPTMYVFMYVHDHICLDFQVRPSKSRLFRSQSIDSERKQKNVQNTNKVPCGKCKTESTRKLSNFYFQWGKTLYQNNLMNIAFFFTFFKGLRCNNKSSVVTPKKIFHGRQRKWMSNFTRYVISIGNSMICSDINNWHKYHEWYFEIVILNFTSR